jgi:hypothetical protein
LAASTDNTDHAGSLAVLRQFVRRPAALAEERCELCAKRLAGDHQHLLEPATRRLLCACEACAILFSNQAARRYRRIPRDVLRLRDFVLDDFTWAALMIPINLAYFVQSSAEGRIVAQYPSPGGALQADIEAESWAAIAKQNPILEKLEADVEALLVNRISSPPQYYVAPIDQCYRLVGTLRKNWRGLSGGPQVWQEVERFFGELRQTAREVSHA